MTIKRTLSHPLWTHIPAVAVLLVLAAALATATLPDSAPIHYGPNGLPDRYGSPLGVLALSIGMSIGFIVLSAWLDELWSRQERRKSFNYFALLDEIVVGAMAGQGLGYLAAIEQAGVSYSSPVREMLWFMAPAIAGALLLERLRPHTAGEAELYREDVSAFRKGLARTVKEGQPFAYSDIQNPAYFNLIALIVPAVMFLSVVLSAAVQPVWTSLLMAAVGILLLSFYGGMRTTVTPDSVTVRLGTPGYRVLRLNTSDITEVALYDYMPLKEFGGYGIRINRHMKGYFLRGGTGTLLTTGGGAKHLIGSNHPERLAEVIRAVARLI